MRRTLLILLGLLVISPVCLAQGGVVDGDAIYNRLNFVPDIGNADFLIRFEPDAVFEDTWYFRVEGDADETVLNNPDVQDYTDNVATLTWNDVGARGLFAAEVVSTVTELSGGRATLQHDMKITNIGAAPLDLHLFAYLDYDLTDTPEDDQAVLIDFPDLIRVSDATYFGEFRGGGASAFQVTETQSGPLSLRDLMMDGLPTNLDNSGLPFTGDWEGAYQWDSLIPVGGTRIFTTFYTINYEIPIIFADGFESGDTSTWSNAQP